MKNTEIWACESGNMVFWGHEAEAKDVLLEVLQNDDTEKISNWGVLIYPAGYEDNDYAEPTSLMDDDLVRWLGLAP